MLRATPSEEKDARADAGSYISSADIVFRMIWNHVLKKRLRIFQLKKDGKILSLFHTTHERQTQNSLASELQFFPAYVRCYL